MADEVLFVQNFSSEFNENPNPSPSSQVNPYLMGMGFL